MNKRSKKTFTISPTASEVNYALPFLAILVKKTNDGNKVAITQRYVSLIGIEFDLNIDSQGA